MGEVLFIAATSGNENSEGKTLVEAIRRFCRSIELCDDYIRGFYGLKMVHQASYDISQYLTCMQASDQLLADLSSDGKGRTLVASTDNAELPFLSMATIRQLNEKSTSKLAELIRRTSGDAHYAAEITAAKELLDRSTQIRQR